MKRWYSFFPLFIVLLIGSGLLSAALAVQQNLPDSLSDYYDKANMFDLMLTCDNGFTDYDIKTLSSDSNVKELEEFWSMEYPSVVAGNDLILQAYSLNDTVSTFQVITGRAPVQSSECIVDELLAELTGVAIGDTITLDPDSTFGDTILNVTQLTIVGICESSFYTSYDRHFSDVGLNGDYCYIVLTKDAFIQPANNLLLTKSSENQSYEAFSSSIDELFKVCLENDYRNETSLSASELENNKQQYSEIEADFTTLSDEAETVEAAYFQTWKDSASISEAARVDIEAKRQALYTVDYSKEDADIALANQEAEVSALEAVTKDARDAYTDAVKDYQARLDEMEASMNALSETIDELQAFLDASNIPDFSYISKSALNSYQSYTEESQKIAESVDSIKAKLIILLAVASALLATLVSLGFVSAVAECIRSGKTISVVILPGILFSVLWSILGVALGSYIGFTCLPSVLYEFLLTVNESVPLADTAFVLSNTIIINVCSVLLIGLTAFHVVFIPLLFFIAAGKRKK